MPPPLTEAELRLMKIVWQKGHATVAEVAAALPKELDLAYNTVLTTLRILETKGYLRHAKAKDARAFVYRPGEPGRCYAQRGAAASAAIFRGFAGSAGLESAGG